MQDLSVVFDDSTLLAALNCHEYIPYFNVSSVNSTMRGKGGVDAATLANNWGIGIEAAKRTHVVITQRGIRRMIHPSLTKRYKTVVGNCDIAVSLSQCLLPQRTKKSSQDKVTRQRKCFALPLIL
jgi:hypothetical protein